MSLITVRPQLRPAYYIFAPLHSVLPRCCICLFERELPEIQPADIRFDFPRKRLGEGSFGIVYRSAVDGWRGATVAVKVLRTEGTVPPEVVAEFRREAATLAALHHPNIIALLGVCFEPAGGEPPQLVTEYAPGGSLEQALYHTSDRRRQLTGFQRRRVALETIAGLVHIHAKGLVHCDLKPANVLLAEDGTAKVADVGLARTLHYAQHTRLTAYMTRATAAGTPIYMAPEQWEEMELTAKTDVYAFGLMLNELQTGVQPWRDVGNPLTLCRKVVDREERPSPVAPGRLGKLVILCWAPAAADRPSMDEVRRALDGCDGLLDGRTYTSERDSEPP
mmetsp:Transcript_15663/g.31629  ORF Transcript_15663/g.31629 Transcript_15663/m.31629 type:complete len:335 (+) Transcript_15663:190-1194(+)